jgi:FKBP-type peptidyl-prolyl cis-trans isomerase
MVIKGWDVGVKTMKRNEKAIFILKPEYGYGASGAGDRIPPNSTLEFEITLLGWNTD